MAGTAVRSLTGGKDKERELSEASIGLQPQPSTKPVSSSAFEKVGNDDPGISFFIPHGDEATARQTLEGYYSDGGKGSAIVAKARTRAGGLAVDPNQVFRLSKDDPNRQVVEANLFDPANPSRLIVALHNTYGDALAKELNRSDHVTQNDPKYGGYILTTDQGLYDKLKGLPYNVILQSSVPEEHDFSTSRWAALNNRPYVNIEAVRGDSAKQRAMLDAVLAAHKQPGPPPPAAPLPKAKDQDQREGQPASVFQPQPGILDRLKARYQHLTDTVARNTAFEKQGGMPGAMQANLSRLQPGAPDVAQGRTLSPQAEHRFWIEAQQRKPQGLVDALTPAVATAFNLTPEGQLAVAAAQAASDPTRAPETISAMFADAPAVGTFGPRSLVRRGAEVGEAAPTYQSNVLKAFENPKVPEKLTRDQALAVLKAPGVKAEELKWLGVDDYLKTKDKFTKGEIANWVRDNQIDVHETVLADTPGGDWVAGSSPSYGPQQGHGALSMPGGENYREVLLTWANRPTEKPGTNMDIIRLRDPQHPDGWHDVPVRHDDPVGMQQWEEMAKENGFEYEITRGGRSLAALQFSEGHFEHPDVLAHLRIGDHLTPDGKRVMVVYEGQSDLQKALREQDVAKSDPTKTWDWKASQILHEKGLSELAPVSEEALKVPSAYVSGKSRRFSYEGDAPLARNYTALTMKRILRMAAEEKLPDGSPKYDAVGWNTAAQQAERYGKALLDQVDKLEYDAGSKRLDAYKDGVKVKTFDQVSVSKLPDYLGQGVAEKMLKELKAEGQSATATLHGKDLTVGAKGYEPVYNVAWPSEANAVGKKFGTSVGKGSVLGGQGKLGVPERAKALTANDLADLRAKHEADLNPDERYLLTRLMESMESRGIDFERAVYRHHLHGSNTYPSYVRSAMQKIGIPLEHAKAVTEIHMMPIPKTMRETVSKTPFNLFQAAPIAAGAAAGAAAALGNRGPAPDDNSQQPGPPPAPESAFSWLERLSGQKLQ